MKYVIHAGNRPEDDVITIDEENFEINIQGPAFNVNCKTLIILLKFYEMVLMETLGSRASDVERQQCSH